jgi:hypothetical protein
MAEIAGYQGVVPFQHYRGDQRLRDPQAMGKAVVMEEGHRTLRRGGGHRQARHVMALQEPHNRRELLAIQRAFLQCHHRHIGGRALRDTESLDVGGGEKSP